MRTAFLLNTLFAIIEVVGGIFTNSISILADALHDLGDSLALGTAWYFERISKRGRDSMHSYGYGRYAVVGAIINALVLIVGSLIVLHEAIGRLSSPEPVHGLGMLLLAFLGVVVNGLAYSRLHAGHSHNVEVVRLHLLEDVLGWIIVLLGAIAIELWSLYILDPILSLAVSAWILYQVIRRLKKSIRIILQNTPSGITIQEVDRLIRAIPGIQTTHDIHLWTMDGDYHILTVHAVVQSQLSMTDLARLKETIRQKLNAVHVKHATIEFEYPDESCVLAEC